MKKKSAVFDAELDSASVGLVRVLLLWKTAPSSDLERN